MSEPKRVTPGPFSPPSSTGSPSKFPRRVGVLLLACVAIFTVLYLGFPLSGSNRVDDSVTIPVVLAEPELTTPPAYEDIPQTYPPADIADDVEESPWTDAQLMRARREAQEILSTLLPLQESLEERAVVRWAETEFAAMQQLALDADALYQSREFDQAITLYSEALKQGEALNAEIDSAAANVVAQGWEAYHRGDQSSAVTEFELAEQMLPGNTEIMSALARARVLNQVDRQLSSARNAVETGDLNVAKRWLEQALAIDPQYQPALDYRQEVLAMLKQQTFQTEMSRGFGALASNNPAPSFGTFSPGKIDFP